MNISIAEICFHLNVNPIITERFLAFLSDGEPDYIIDVQEVDTIPLYSEYKSIYEEVGLKVLSNKECLKVFVDYKNDDFPYAYAIFDKNNNKVNIRYIFEGRDFFNTLHSVFFHTGWESILLNENRLLFHACAVKSEIGGILFSGDSGIGKSTQGDLWVKYENAEIINGDRPVLYKKDEKWIAYGSPYAGSSKVHKNENVPIKIIVMLKQAKTNSIRRLSLYEAFRNVYAQMVTNSWDKECSELVLCNTEQLIKEIPVYELSCTPDRCAVELLKATLHGGDCL